LAWRVEFSASASKELEKLGPDNARRILRFLKQRVLKAQHPRMLGEALRGPELGRFWKYRIGPFRVIARIEDGRMIVFVVRIGHRREIYR